MANIVGDVAELGYSEGDNTGMGAKIGAGTKGDADGPEEVEGKIDIWILDKANKIFILISY